MSIAPTIALSLLLVSTAQASSVELLKDLRTRLDAIRSGPPTTAAEPPPISLAELVGVTRTELLTNLGEPSVCTSGLKPRPCPEAQQWWYSFYKLAPKTFGGGPELAITFSDANSVSASQVGANTEAASASDRVRAAAWFVTR